jgi:hypothetical protein
LEVIYTEYFYTYSEGYRRSAAEILPEGNILRLMKVS